MTTEDQSPRITRRRFLTWAGLAAASAGAAPLLAAGCGSAQAPAPAATASGGAPKAAAPTQPPAKAGVLELKLDHHEPAGGHLGRTFQAYADYVAKASNGSIHITVYPSETLSKAADSLTNCANGVSDIAWTAISYYPGQFKLNEAFMMPMIGITSGKHGARAMTQWFKQSPQIQKEWANVHVLASFCNGIQLLHTSKKRVAKLEDVAGLKIRASGFGGTNYIKTIGGNPQSIGIPDSYEALAKGVIDGGAMDWQAVDSNRMYEVLKYSVTLTLYNTPQGMAFNQKKWDSLTPEQQKILQDVPGLQWQDWDPENKGPAPSLGEFLANGFDLANAPGAANFKKAGGELVTLAPDEEARWVKAAEPVWNMYFEQVKNEPWDAKKEFAAMQDLIKKTK